MGCPSESELLGFVDRTVPVAVIDQIEAHLDACEVCRSAVATFVRAYRPATPPAAPALVEMPRAIGPFEIRSLLGAGGMGVVYRAHDPRLGRDVAIKVLPARMHGDDAWLARFQREARAIATLSHPNVLALHDVGVHEGAPYLVSELLEGDTLRAALRDGPIPLRRGLSWAAQIAHGLAAVHQRGLVHRDLKPENIFITRTGVKLLDFGLATDGVVAAAGESVPGTVVGTLAYMAPEQLLGRPVDAKTDLFAFGLVCHEMLTGTHPFRRATDEETAAALLSDEVEVRELRDRPGLGVILERCLAKDPDSRFQSARDLGFALEAIEAVRSEPRRRPSAWRGRWPVLAALLALAAIVVVSVRPGRGPGPVPPFAAASFKRMTFHTGRVGWARFGTGDQIYFTALWDESAHIRVTSSAAVAEPVVPPWSALMAVSRRGELLLVADDMLERLVPGSGAPRPVIEFGGPADFAPDGDTIAAAHEVAGITQLEYPIGHVLHRQASGTIHDVRVSPSGNEVAFVTRSNPPDMRGSVLLASRTGEVRELAGPFDWAAGLAWRPDGREVWFTTEDAIRAVTRDRRSRIVLTLPGAFRLEDIDRDGRLLVTSGHARTVLKRLRGDTLDDLSWFAGTVVTSVSADGQRFTFYEGAGPSSRPGDQALFVRATDGSPPTRLGDGRTIALTPDARRVVMLTAQPELVVAPIGPGTAATLPRGDVVHYESLGLAVSPDGAQVAFVASGREGQTRVYVQPLDGSRAPRPIGPAGAHAPGYAVAFTPDSQAVVERGPDRRLVVVPLDDSVVRPVPDSMDANLVGVRSDGAIVVVAPGPPYLLTAVDPASGTRTPIRSIVPPEIEARPAPWIVTTADLSTILLSYEVTGTDLYVVTPR